MVRLGSISATVASYHASLHPFEKRWYKLNDMKGIFMNEKEMIKITNYLNTQGYDFDRSDGLWMEDCVDNEHKWRDIFGFMHDWAKVKLNELSEKKCDGCIKSIGRNCMLGVNHCSRKAEDFYFKGPA